MNIIKDKKDNKLSIILEGRLDTSTSPQLEEEIKSSVSDVCELTMDFKNLDYLSSAGLRVILEAQKIMNIQGSMVIRNVNDIIMEVFEVTGFSDILTIE